VVDVKGTDLTDHKRVFEEAKKIGFDNGLIDNVRKRHTQHNAQHSAHGARRTAHSTRHTARAHGMHTAPGSQHMHAFTS
jgi:hypothetical protein